MTNYPIRHRRRATFVRRIDPLNVALLGVVVLLAVALAASVWLVVR